MIDRRRFIEIGTAAAGVLSGGALGSALAADTGSAPGATVQTAAGKIRGVLQDKVHTFKGVPYAASTAGAGRFMPPAKPKPWKGVRDTVNYGARSPQLLSLFHGWVPPEVEVMDRDEPMSEECLFLNVWTAGLERAAKRPVMVWLHGGGYTSGSGAFYCYDGSQLAAKHDVVALTVNHRLSVLGYLYLAGLGSEKYAQSSNVGMLDIVAALEWVRDNIAAFGGDPGNVTIFGQSGGGGKVSTLMAMPAAKGLFHRAIVQSGAAIKGTSRDAATRTAKAYLARLNVQPNELDKLASFSADQLLAVTEASKGPPLDFGPVTDGQTLPTDPFDPTAPALSADVPLLIGTVETEVTFFPNQILDPIDDATLHARVKQIVRGASDAQTDKLIAAYRAGRPKVANTDLYLIIASDATFRAGVVLEAERKAAQARAPVYQYYWTWHSPVREGKLRAFHTIEIPFVFDNVDAAQSMVGKGADRYALATRISDAFTSFARTGTPDHENLPHWPAFDLTRRAVMIFDNDTRVENDPHGDEQRLLHAIQSGAA
ncbi:MAG TPA: carboxylesterase/lipase family protein [Steroidobacteraceae bacterium]|nr:carboxylesterase/lipase family protein [Steroidobacteraceae bacterium]